jgi:hypothetical protein
LKELKIWIAANRANRALFQKVHRSTALVYGRLVESGYVYYNEDFEYIKPAENDDSDDDEEDDSTLDDLYMLRRENPFVSSTRSEVDVLRYQKMSLEHHAAWLKRKCRVSF